MAQRLQRIQNGAARLVVGVSKCNHVIAVLAQLQWFLLCSPRLGPWFWCLRFKPFMCWDCKETLRKGIPLGKGVTLIHIHHHSLPTQVGVKTQRMCEEKPWEFPYRDYATCLSVSPKCHLPGLSGPPAIHSERGPEVIYERSGLLCGGSNSVEATSGEAMPGPLPVNA